MAKDAQKRYSLLPNSSYALTPHDKYSKQESWSGISGTILNIRGLGVLTPSQRRLVYTDDIQEDLPLWPPKQQGGIVTCHSSGSGLIFVRALHIVACSLLSPGATKTDTLNQLPQIISDVCLRALEMLLTTAKAGGGMQPRLGYQQKLQTKVKCEENHF